ncbi:MAG: hypothetical protein IJR90_08440, partial [Clostridia bacterium]|nr:hypothetical protein [Clostridia bacterium]
MNSKKRVIGVILAVVIVISCIPVMSVTVSATEYSQSNAGDLFTALSNGSVTNIALTSDIDMSAQGVLTSQSAGSVTITGNGHIIKNLKTTRGLFSEVSSCAVSNLGLYNCSVIDMSSSGEGYGLLFGKVGGGTISGCAVAGEIAVYGSASGIGGLVGVNNGASISNSFSMVDIYTDGSYVGGLVGNVNSGSVGTVYSTGKIENEGSNYIGGLVGSSSVSISNAYTTVFIKNAYADTVKAIGNGTFSNVYYDKSISLQRQGDLDDAYDIASITTSNIGTKLSGFSYSEQLYPGLTDLNSNFSNLALISRARVDLELPRTSDLLTGSTGREFMKPSTATAYSFATLSHGGNLGFDWEISGGIDEYFFDPSSAPETAYGGTINGLSGNTYDVSSGKYLFVNTGDVAFTAKSGGYERTITVHVTDDNPYFSSAAAPFSVTDRRTLDNVRLYCLDGAYTFNLSSDISLSSADPYSGLPQFAPIIGFKGIFNGNNHTISGLNVNALSCPGSDAGLFGTVTGAATISGLHIANGTVSGSFANAGLLIGKVNVPNNTPVNVSGCLVSGNVDTIKTDAATNLGMIAGDAGTASISTSAAMGNVGSSTGTATPTYAGGLVGSMSSTGTLTDCYSTAVVQGTTAGGLSGNGGTYTTCLFTGMFKDCGTVNPLGSGTNSG